MKAKNNVSHMDVCFKFVELLIANFYNAVEHRQFHNSDDLRLLNSWVCMTGIHLVVTNAKMKKQNGVHPRPLITQGANCARWIKV